MNRTAITATAALVAAALSATLAASASAGTQPPRCDPGHLAVTLSRPVASGGNTGLTVTETNDGEYACTIGGYPHVRLWLHRHGKDYRVDAVVTHGSTYFQQDPGSTISDVAPGASVTASVAFSSSDPRKAVRAVGLVVRDRGTAWGLPVAFPEGDADVDGAGVTTTAWEGAQ